MCIDTVDRIYALLPELKQWIPAGIDISVLADRTQTIRASVHDMQLTLAATVASGDAGGGLFLRRLAATMAAGITVPLSLAGTCAAMWVAGFSIDNLSLMALAVCGRLRGRRRHRDDRERVPQPGEGRLAAARDA